MITTDCCKAYSNNVTPTLNDSINAYNFTNWEYKTPYVTAEHHFNLLETATECGLYSRTLLKPICLELTVADPIDPNLLRESAIYEVFGHVIFYF